MSTPPYWFGNQLIGFLGKDISIHARAGYPTGYRMLDRVRLWITGPSPWPEVLVREIPEDFFPWQGRYIFEPLDSTIELLEEGPFDPTPIPFNRVEVTGLARTAPVENGISGRATAEARITLDLEEGQQVARIVIEPSARKASVEVGGFELWRAQPGEGR